MCGVAHSVNLVVFFFNDTATTEIYTLSLHDALPISEFNLATWLKMVKFTGLSIREFRFFGVKCIMEYMVADCCK